MAARVGVRQLQRAVARDGLDYYPSPPWATRALFEVLPTLVPGARYRPGEMRGWDPACGQGHMAHVMREYFASVDASDVQDLGYGRVEDFLDSEREADWIVTNPPFNRALEFAERATRLARHGVALLARLQLIEGKTRFERVFSRQTWHCAAFVERVGFNPGFWDPARDRGVTAHAWFVWVRGPSEHLSRLTWIRPGCRERLTRDGDSEWARSDGRSCETALPRPLGRD